MMQKNHKINITLPNHLIAKIVEKVAAHKSATRPFKLSGTMAMDLGDIPHVKPF